MEVVKEVLYAINATCISLVFRDYLSFGVRSTLMKYLTEWCIKLLHNRARGVAGSFLSNLAGGWVGHESLGGHVTKEGRTGIPFPGVRLPLTR